MIQEPIQPTPSPTPEARGAWHRGPAKAGLSVAALILLAIPLVMAMAASAPSVSPAKVLAAGASAAPSAGRAGKPEGGKGDHHGLGGNRGRGAPVRGPITIRAINGNQVSLASDDGWTRTITLTPTTAITRGGATIAPDALKVGDLIGFKETRNTDGSYSITAMHVVLPTSGGVVTKVEGNDITVKGRNGTATVIHVSGSTIYKMWGRATATLSDIAVGDGLIADGTLRSDGSLDAVTVFAGRQGHTKPPKAPAPATSAVPG